MSPSRKVSSPRRKVTKSEIKATGAAETVSNHSDHVSRLETETQAQAEALEK